MPIFGSKKPEAELEIVPPGEDDRIAKMVALTAAQLKKDYPDKRCLRAVHPKDHGCVQATFVVDEKLAEKHQVGVFKQPGKTYRAAIRFSNASGQAGPDGPRGARGMAIKLYDVRGDRLVDDGEESQDFLMINQPVFVFANAEDYQALMELGRQKFFTRSPLGPEAQKRTAKSLAIGQHTMGELPPPGPFPFPAQAPPRSPLDNVYFSAAPFLFGKGRAMKFCAKPVNPDPRPPVNAEKPNYLRDAMRERMAAAGGKNICFDFQIQVRDAKGIDLATDIEDACTLWNAPFETVARINIPPQKFDSREQMEFCETLFFTPWHGLKAHRPLGGINRVRQAVYKESSAKRGGKASRAFLSASRPG